MKFASRKVIFERLRSSSRKFCSHTTFHGFHYITDPNSSKFKVYFWSVVCLISTCLCFMLIRTQIYSYYSNRITTTIATTAFPISKVPFPAITICNYNHIYKSNIDKIKHIFEKNVTSEAARHFFNNLSSLVLNKHILNSNVKWSTHYKMVKLLEKAGYNTEKVMSTLAHPCDRMITDCYWNDEEKNCSKIFNLTKTNYGFCCSFNYRRYVEKVEEELYVAGVGPAFGFYAHLHTEPEEYFSTEDPTSALDISIHENFEYPDMSIYSAAVRAGHDVSLNVKPEITESEESVMSIPMETRGCVFAEEVQMKWTHKYSYATCIHRCKSKVIRAYCGCMPFYYVAGGKASLAKRRRFCSLLDMPCLIKNYYKFQNATKKSQESNNDHKCDVQCYPQCNVISYSFQIDQEQLETLDENNVRKDVDYIILRVYFGQISCTKLLRSVLLTWQFILASVGGLIGLSLGGSILSIIEFVYHFFETIFSKYPTINNQHEKKPKKNKKQKTEETFKIYISDFKSLRRNKTSSLLLNK